MTARAATIPPTIAPMGAAVVRRKIITVKKESSLTFETNTHEREERFCNVNEATRNNRHILGAGPCFKQQTGSCSTHKRWKKGNQLIAFAWFKFRKHGRTETWRVQLGEINYKSLLLCHVLKKSLKTVPWLINIHTSFPQGTDTQETKKKKERIKLRTTAQFKLDNLQR